MYMMVPEASATHNRAGEITYVQTGPLSVKILITTYTKTSSMAADRDSLEVYWGDGSSEFVVRSNGEGDPLENDVKINYYEAEHTYPGRSTYTVGFTDPNRVNNILNVNWPNSVEVEFYLSTTFTFLDPQFQGTNSSAVLLQAPIDIACVGKRFTHNPNAFDADGDSLSYHLIAPKMSAQEDVPAYVFPDQISPGPNNDFSINPTTGDITWESPQLQGEYNIAIRIDEWRKGVLINSIIRDMQILVIACDNEPPLIDAPEEICVIAGEEIEFKIGIDDPDAGQRVKLSFTGGPFQVSDNPATIDATDNYESVPFESTFSWKTTCNHISKEYYQVVLKAEDNGFSSTSGLATLQSVKIKVIGPPPENLEAETENGDIRLFWDSPYACEITDNEFFRGFSVWRQTGADQIELDTCDPGLSKTSYEKIVFRTLEISEGRYTALDQTVEKGKTYCYRVQAEFAQLTSSGNPFNRIESLSSNDVCLQLARDIPLITRNSILTTSENGDVEIHFARPLASELDTIENPGPYEYRLYRSVDDEANYELISGFTRGTEYFNETIDTTFIDTGVNTIVNQPYYKIALYASDELTGISSSASSVFLEIAGQDRALSLSWSADVPWSNKIYYIYKEDESGAFIKIDSTIQQSYVDVLVENNKEYCYYIIAEDSYGIPNIDDPLINLSQQVCAMPFDNNPPCKPILQLYNICNKEDGPPVEIGENYLYFNRVGAECEELEPIAYYNIYYSSFDSSEMKLIDQSDFDNYIHVPEFGLYGCYAVSAVDENGNESERSEPVCVQSCPEYELPNTFTPNGDNANDFFEPLVNQFIGKVDMNVYNEWGNRVFSTEDPEINWSGNDTQGKYLPEGTYYYSCRVFEVSAGGLLEGSKVLTGYIHLIR